MKKLILSLATVATLFVGSLAVTNTAEARPYRYYGGYYGAPYYRGYAYRPYTYYRPYAYRSYYGAPRYYNPGYRTASPGIYLGAPGVGVYVR